MCNKFLRTHLCRSQFEQQSELDRRHQWVGGNRSKERDRKSELVLRSTIPNF